MYEHHIHFKYEWPPGLISYHFKRNTAWPGLEETHIIHWMLHRLYAVFDVFNLKNNSAITQGTKTIHCICQYICRSHSAQIRNNCRSGKGSNQFSSTDLHTLSLRYRFKVFGLNNASRFHARQKVKRILLWSEQHRPT